MASAITIILHALQAAFSAYNLYLASIPITKLREYEETSEKAAKYSNIAADQLHKTRMTQASGTAAVGVLLMLREIDTDRTTRFFAPSLAL